MSEANTINQAGDYQIDIAELISYRIHGGESKPYRINVLPIILSLELSEDILSNNMVGVLTVYDTQDIRTVLPITGLEKLNLKFSTPGLTGVNANEEEGYPFQVYKVDNVRQDPVNVRGQLYRIFFCSQEMYYDSLQKVSRAFSGPTEDGVEKIFRGKEFLNSKKPLFFEPTKTNTKVVMPNLHPFEAINFLAKKSISGQYANSGYMFYENPKGYFFRSLESMLAMGGAVARPAKFAYKYQTTNVREGDTRDVNADMRNVIKYDFLRPVNTLFNIREGMYGNKLTVHDMTYKTFVSKEYDYNKEFGNFFHTEHDEGNKATDKSTMPIAKFEDTNKDLSQFISKTMTIGSSSKLHDDYEQVPDFDLQDQISKRIQMRNINLNLLVFGNSLINCGDIITFDLPLMRPLGDEKQEPNPQYSGRYLIMAIKHVINVDAGRYEMVLKCMKDAVKTPYVNELDTNITPTAKQGVYDIYKEDSNILSGDLLENT